MKAAKQKCDELIEKFKPNCYRINENGAIQIEAAKQCALICASELFALCARRDDDSGCAFWELTQREIEKL